MYRGKFYTSSDFTPPEAEQNLRIFWDDRLEGIWHYDEFRTAGSLRHLMHTERLEGTLPRNESQRMKIVELLLQQGWHDAEEIVFGPQEPQQWRKGLKKTFSELKKPPEIDVGFITQTWFLRRDELDEVWLGIGHGKWLLVHWYSTA